MAAKKEKLSFEAALEKLETLVEQLESGEFGLEESLAQFEQGVTLYQACRKELVRAEKKLSELSEALKEEPLEFPQEES